jgi:rubrerythrin
MENKTIQNLKDAFKGETTASAKYAAYSKKAKEEGFEKIAKLFEATPHSEKIHANNHKRVLEKLGEKTDEVIPKFEVKTTKENLQDAISGETYEVITMYPDFIKTAKDANIKTAIETFDFAYRTEKKHKFIYENALKTLEAGNESTLPSTYYVCPICGNTFDIKVPDKCGICSEPAEKFIIFK